MRTGLFQGTFIIPDIEGIVAALLVILRKLGSASEEVLKSIKDILDSSFRRISW